MRAELEVLIVFATFDDAPLVSQIIIRLIPHYLMNFLDDAHLGGNASFRLLPLYIIDSFG